MSYHVFMVYTYAIACIVLLPSQFLFSNTTNRSAGLALLSISVLSKISLLGLIGGTLQILGYAGIVYSSPALASAMSDLTPAFTFSLAIIFRMERRALRSSSSQAKLLGTIVSISGALIVSLYQGPPIALAQSSSISLGLDIELASVLCLGVFVSFLSNISHTWVVHMKGPVYVAMFTPLSIAIAVAIGVVMLLGDVLYLGR